ncbi:MAG: uroporphyrinogen decarboxylase family protein [Planctomycetota bacterium]
MHEEPRHERLLWEPACYEHKARLIGKAPFEVARSADLLARAVLEERRLYQPDFLTVGIDVYNVEAEACGAALHDAGPMACPELAGAIFSLDALPRGLALPAVPGAGRFGMLLEAGARVRDAVGAAAKVRVGITGPLSLAAKLAGLEPVIMGLAEGNEPASRLLEFSTALGEAWAGALQRAGLDGIVFDSIASPPIISPAMYARCILPLHKRLLGALEKGGQAERALVIGGRTAALAKDLVAADATMLVCDFPADARAFAAALPGAPRVRVRRNVNPAVLAGPAADLRAAAQGLANDLRLFALPVAGTGILPYDTEPSRVQTFHRLVLEAWAAGR